MPLSEYKKEDKDDFELGITTSVNSIRDMNKKHTLASDMSVWANIEQDAVLPPNIVVIEPLKPMFKHQMQYEICARAGIENKIGVDLTDIVSSYAIQG